MSPKNQSDTHIVHFTSGQWDTHPGNILIDETGTPVLIDNEVILMLQMARYGEFPFLMRGKQLAEEGPLRPEEFPFDSAQVLVNPSYEELAKEFSPYVTQAQLKRIYDKIPYAVDRTISFVRWKSAFWVQTKRHRMPSHASVYSRSTLEGLRGLNPGVLRNEVLPPRFTDDHIHLILDRTTQVLRASENAPSIP
jgi:hypothetical protein